MSTAEKPAPPPAPVEVDEEANDNLTHDEWGNGMVYVSEGDDTGAWVGYDPDTMVDLDDWR